MSDPNLPEDRSLVRRFNFLGFPGEKQNGGLTYASLRAQLGDDNASSLVVKIGVLAEKYHLNQLGVGIDGTIARILGSISSDEMRSIAQNNGVLPSRVENMIRAEAEAAKVQQAQLGKGNAAQRDPTQLPTGLSQVGYSPFAALRGFPMQPAGSSDAANNRSGYQDMAYGSPKSLQGVSLANFAGSPFAKTGMDFSTFNYVRGQDRNYTGQNVIDAANDAKNLGFSARDKQAVRDHADIRHYDPEHANDDNQDLKKYEDDLATSNDQKALQDRLRATTNPQERAALQKQIKDLRQGLAEKDHVAQDQADPTKHVKVRKAITRRRTAIEKKFDELNAPSSDAKAAAPTDRDKQDVSNPQRMEESRKLLEQLRAKRQATAPKPGQQ